MPTNDIEYQREWIRNNRDKSRLYNARYREKHRKEVNKRIREWKRANYSDKVKELNRMWKREHPEKGRAYSRKYAKGHPRTVSAARVRYRATAGLGYIRGLLTNGSCLRAKDIPKVLAEAKQWEIKIRRVLHGNHQKTVNNG